MEAILSAGSGGARWGGQDTKGKRQEAKKKKIKHTDAEWAEHAGCLLLALHLFISHAELGGTLGNGNESDTRICICSGTGRATS